MQPGYASFSETEHRARLAKARRLLREAGIGHCLCVAPESLYYYGGYDSWVSVNSPQALIFSTEDDEPTIVLRDTDVPLARENSWINDLRPYRLMSDDIPALMAQVAGEKGLRNGKVAIETQSYALSHHLGQAIARALVPARMIDATALLGQPRLLKSPAEMAFVRKAAEHAQRGLAAARRALRPGLSETALAAEVGTRAISDALMTSVIPGLATATHLPLARNLMRKSSRSSFATLDNTPPVIDGSSASFFRIPVFTIIRACVRLQCR